MFTSCSSLAFIYKTLKPSLITPHTFSANSPSSPPFPLASILRPPPLFPPPTMSEAPLEIIEIILSHLRNDFPALTRCSLVRRDWVAICRQWLFRDVDVTGYRLTSRYARYQKFIDLTRGRVPPTFTRCVRRLQLDATLTPYHIAGFASISLPNLHSIRIKPCSTCLPPYLLSAVSTVFSERIDDLDITGLVFPSPTALVQFLCAFPRLKQLSLGDNAFASTPTYGNQLVVPPNLHLSSNLASLRISQELGIADSSVLSWVIGQLKKHGSLKKLEYRANGWFTVFPEELLMGVTETVEELDLYFVSTDTTSLQRKSPWNPVVCRQANSLS